MDNNEIDFIKWKIDKTEYFTYFETNGEWFISFDGCAVSFVGIEKDQVVNPLLLQKAIEGINKESYFGNSQIEIVSHRWGIQIKDYSTDNHDKKHFRFETYEDYKEQSLKYIFEQEKTNG